MMRGGLRRTSAPAFRRERNDGSTRVPRRSAPSNSGPICYPGRARARLRARSAVRMTDPANAARIAADPIRIAQRYQVIKALGQGGMAHVYHVTDAVSGRELALKQ